MAVSRDWVKQVIPFSFSILKNNKLPKVFYLYYPHLIDIPPWGNTKLNFCSIFFETSPNLIEISKMYNLTYNFKIILRIYFKISKDSF